MTRLAVVLATAGGAGYAPMAPGTAGSAVGALVYFLVWQWPVASQIALLVALSVAGIWAGDQAARHFGREDPGEVVIDEVAGQLLTLIATGGSLAALILGFLLFRVLDIVKPWPVRRLEDLPGGLGIMADDLMAGLFGRLVMAVAIFFAPSLF
jgi:phosphatidylglycerophosphatase A